MGIAARCSDIPPAMRRFISAFLEAFVKFGRAGCAFLAQSVAFSALFAFFPLMFLGLAAATLVFPDPERRLLQAVDQVAPTLHDYVAQNLHAYISGRGISSVIAFVTLIWSGSLRVSKKEVINSIMRCRLSAIR